MYAALQMPVGHIFAISCVNFFYADKSTELCIRKHDRTAWACLKLVES